MPSITSSRNTIILLTNQMCLENFSVITVSSHVSSDVLRLFLYSKVTNLGAPTRYWLTVRSRCSNSQIRFDGKVLK